MHLLLIVLVAICSSLITLSTHADETEVEVNFSWSNCVDDICNVRASVYAPATFYKFPKDGYGRVGWLDGECRKTGEKYSFLVRFVRCNKNFSGMSRSPIQKFNGNQDLLEPALFFQHGDSWSQNQDNTLVLDCSLYRLRRIQSYRQLVVLDDYYPANVEGDVPLTAFSELVNFNRINWSSAVIDSEYKMGRSWDGDIQGTNSYSFQYSTVDGTRKRISIGDNLDSTQLRRRENALDYIQSQCPGVASRF